jgi:mannan endo-1,6-alpha-mannosidase
MARQIFEWNWQKGWDVGGKCGGGMWFDQTLGGKAAITNVQMLQLGARLFRLQGKNDTALLGKVMKEWNFIQTTKLVNPVTFLTADAVNITAGNCSNNGAYGPTYSNGVLAGGLLEMWLIFHDDDYLDLAQRIVNATVVDKTVNGTFMEYCDVTGCGDDQKVFKGIFVRNLRYLMDYSNATTRAMYATWLRQNMESVIANDKCEPNGNTTKCHVVYLDGPPFNSVAGPVFSEKWNGPFNYSAPMQQASILDLFVSNIQVGTTCTGAACNYDPPTPPPHPLTCKDNPCPPGKPCCKFDNSYTCCGRDQKCVSGVCT